MAKRAVTAYKRGRKEITNCERSPKVLFTKGTTKSSLKRGTE
jgi:hypothetical protein